MHRRVFVLFGCFALGCFAGCGGGTTDQPDLGTVSGMVKVAGKPLPNAIVNFTPSGTGRPSTAVTDDSGNYTLNYLTDTQGAVIGQHKVTVERVSTEEEDNMTDEQLAALALPASASDNSIVKDVKAGDNTIDIDIQ